MKKEKILLLAGIVFISCNLRAAITAVGPLSDVIAKSLSLSGAAIGVLTTIPLVVFAAMSPVVSGLDRRLGAGRLIICAMAALTAGTLIRSYLGVAGLFSGSVLVGIGISICNVMLPAIIKARFPNQLGALTSLYTTLMAVFAALASGASVPIAQNMGMDWRHALAVWALPAFVTLILWLFLSRLRINGAAKLGEKKAAKSLIHTSTAWWVAAYMGLQSLLYYAFVAWLPAMLLEKGVSAETAGYYAGVFQLVAIPTSAIVPLIAGRSKNQKLLSAVISGTYAAGMTLFLFAREPAALWLSVILCSLCSGACISLAMSMIMLRASDAATAARLSGMAQAAGYTLAAAGPLAAGAVFDALGSWRAPILGLCVATCLLLIAGIKAGTDKRI